MKDYKISIAIIIGSIIIATAIFLPAYLEKSKFMDTCVKISGDQFWCLSKWKGVR